MRSVKFLAAVMVTVLLGLGGPGKVRAEWVYLNESTTDGTIPCLGFNYKSFEISYTNTTAETRYAGLFFTDIFALGLIFSQDEGFALFHSLLEDVNIDSGTKYLYLLSDGGKLPVVLLDPDSHYLYAGVYKEIGPGKSYTFDFWFGWLPEYVDPNHNFLIFATATKDFNDPSLSEDDITWRGVARFGDPPPTVVPVPGAALLFGSGLLGLAFFRRRLKRR